MKQLAMPFQVGWDVTHKCNYRCKHCLFSAEQLSDPTSLSRDEAIAFVEHLVEKKIFHLSIAGGEPLLYPHLVEVIHTAARAGISTAISTNASLLTHEFAAQLQAAGLRAVQISLDGHTASLNDAIRGKGAFQRTLRGLEIALSHGFTVTLAIVILRQNAATLSEYFDFAERLGVRGIKVQTLIRSGLAEVNAEDLELGPTEIRSLLLKLWEVKRTRDGPLEIMLPLVDGAEYGSAPEHFYRDVSCLGCQPGVSTVRVNAAGDVRACGGDVNAPSIGNVVTIPLQSIWRDSQELIRWRNESAVAAGETATSCGTTCGKGCRSTTAPKFARS